MPSIEYQAGRRDGLSKALEIVGEHMGPEQPKEVIVRMQSITRLIREEINRTMTGADSP